MAKFISMKNIGLSNYYVNADGDIVRKMKNGTFKAMSLLSNNMGNRSVARYDLTDDNGERYYLSLRNAAEYFTNYYERKILQ